MSDPTSTARPTDDLILWIAEHIGHIHTIEPFGEGLDNTAWLVNRELVVRQALEIEPEAIRREAALLDIVARSSTLRVPEIVFSEPGMGILAYPMLPGRPLIDIANAHLLLDAGPLGDFLRAIHGIPLPAVESIAPLDNEPLAEWLEEAVEGYARVANRLPPSARRLIEGFLAEGPPEEAEALTLCHNDLGAEHILVDPATMRITGIIDWTDAGITDPMRDLALIFRDFGPDVLGHVLAQYNPGSDRDASAQDEHRLVFYARCKLIEDLVYGLESDVGRVDRDRYLSAALAHMEWTFG